MKVQLDSHVQLLSAYSITTSVASRSFLPVEEVREITETLAQKLVILSHQIHFNSLETPVDRDALKLELRQGIEKYAEDFGPRPAQQLEAYVHHQYALESPRTFPRSRGR